MSRAGCRTKRGTLRDGERRWHPPGQDGATLVEFAIVLIMLLLIFFGIMGFGHALYAYHFVSHASKTATRWAAVNGFTCNGDTSCNGTYGMNNGPASPDDIKAYVLTLVPSGLDPTKVTTTPSWGLPPAPIPAQCAGTPNYPGCLVQVQVGYSYSFIFPLLPTSTGAQTNNACGSIRGFCLSSMSQMTIVH